MMATQALERAARAAANADAKLSNGPSLYANNPDIYQKIARAVLMAVREPDEAMKLAGGRAIFERPQLFNPVGQDNWPEWEDGTLLNVELSALSCHSHRAMIDAILNDGEGE